MWTDGQTYRHDEANSRFWAFLRKLPKKRLQPCIKLVGCFVYRRVFTARYGLLLYIYIIYVIFSSLSANLRKATFPFVSSVCLSVRPQLGSHWTDSHEI